EGTVIVMTTSCARRVAGLSAIARTRAAARRIIRSSPFVARRHSRISFVSDGFDRPDAMKRAVTRADRVHVPRGARSLPRWRGGSIAPLRSCRVSFYFLDAKIER